MEHKKHLLDSLGVCRCVWAELPLTKRNTSDTTDTEIKHGGYVVRSGVFLPKVDPSLIGRFVDVEFGYGADGAALIRFTFPRDYSFSQLSVGELWDFAMILRKINNGTVSDDDVARGKVLASRLPPRQRDEDAEWLNDWIKGGHDDGSAV